MIQLAGMIANICTANVYCFQIDFSGQQTAARYKWICTDVDFPKINMILEIKLVQQMNFS